MKVLVYTCSNMDLKHWPSMEFQHIHLFFPSVHLLVSLLGLVCSAIAINWSPFQTRLYFVVNNMTSILISIIHRNDYFHSFIFSGQIPFFFLSNQGNHGSQCEFALTPMQHQWNSLRIPEIELAAQSFPSWKTYPSIWQQFCVKIVLAWPLTSHLQASKGITRIAVANINTRFWHYISAL